MQTKVIPRGIRNNNPLNIRIGNTWLGEVKNPTETQFEQFVSMEYGLRAAFCILRRYINKYHRCTITQIIESWAPSSENNTRAYIDSVVQLTGIPADQPLDYYDEKTMCKLVAAMAQVECGQPIDIKAVGRGYALA